jgi:serine/threonine protein kinase
MSPEQALGRQSRIDARADLFSVGALVFRALSGRRIHEKETSFETLMAASRDPAPRLAQAIPGAGPALAAAVDRAMAFDPDARWQTAREMFEALRAAYVELEGARGRLRRRSMPSSGSLDVSVAWGADSRPSAVEDVAFGAHRDEALARERMRTRGILEGLSGVSVVVDPDVTIED